MFCEISSKHFTSNFHFSWSSSSTCWSISLNIHIVRSRTRCVYIPHTFLLSAQIRFSALSSTEFENEGNSSSALNWLISELMFKRSSVETAISPKGKRIWELNVRRHSQKHYCACNMSAVCWMFNKLVECWMNWLNYCRWTLNFGWIKRIRVLLNIATPGVP